jgi:hypothetical protein
MDAIAGEQLPLNLPSSRTFVVSDKPAQRGQLEK